MQEKKEGTLRSVSEFNVVEEKLREIQEESGFIEHVVVLVMVLGFLKRTAMDRSAVFLGNRERKGASGKQEEALCLIDDRLGLGDLRFLYCPRSEERDSTCF